MNSSQRQSESLWILTLPSPCPNPPQLFVLWGPLSTTVRTAGGGWSVLNGELGERAVKRETLKARQDDIISHDCDGLFPSLTFVQNVPRRREQIQRVKKRTGTLTALFENSVKSGTALPENNEIDIHTDLASSFAVYGAPVAALCTPREDYPVQTPNVTHRRRPPHRHTNICIFRYRLFSSAPGTRAHTHARIYLSAYHAVRNSLPPTWNSHLSGSLLTPDGSRNVGQFKVGGSFHVAARKRKEKPPFRSPHAGTWLWDLLVETHICLS